jgi:hypothetical protein
MGLAEPFMTSSASWVAGAAEHVARMAAQGGTVGSVGCALGDGLGIGLGYGLGDGLGDWLGEGLAAAEGLEWATAGPFGEQAATASSTPMSTSPLLTRP